MPTVVPSTMRRAMSSSELIRVSRAGSRRRRSGGVRLSIPGRLCACSADVLPFAFDSRRGRISQQVTFGHVARQASIRFSGLAFDKVLGYVFALAVAKTYGSTAFGLYIFGVGCFE